MTLASLIALSVPTPKNGFEITILATSLSSKFETLISFILPSMGESKASLSSVKGSLSGSLKKYRVKRSSAIKNSGANPNNTDIANKIKKNNINLYPAFAM